ncbi:MAG: DUF1800 domain-containing protein [Solirubrobacterales bacterium]
MSRHRSSSPIYKGHFGQAEAERLLWRAGFGPRPGEAKKLARLGMKRAVGSLLNHRGKTTLIGPPPKLDEKLQPGDIWGHDHLWWLDRMVRSNNPLQERMALVWHDWFATSNDGVGSQTLMIKQNYLFRRNALGSFKTMTLQVTKDPAMLLWLSGVDNREGEPNENYGRELMELFTLGAGAHYTEKDVREQARALTGFTLDWTDDGPRNFHFSPKRHDKDSKTIFKKHGNFDWRDSVNLCLHHPDHAGYFVKKLWSYFIPVPLKGHNYKAMRSIYVSNGFKIRPVVQAILMHPAFYNGPSMVKPPVVFTAGLMRTRNAGITSDAWSWLADLAGQRLFYPPNVSGWDDSAWLDTGTFRGRWNAVRYATDDDLLDPGDDKITDAQDEAENGAQALARALAYWGNPKLSKVSTGVLLDFANQVGTSADSADWRKKPYRVMRQNALRTLIAMSPDRQTC